MEDTIELGKEYDGERWPPPPPPIPPAPPPPPREKECWGDEVHTIQGMETNSKNKGVSIWALNIEGLTRNFKSLTTWIQKITPQVVLLSETWVQAHEGKTYEIAGYDKAEAPAIKRNNMGRPSGGMMEYTRQISPWIVELENEGEPGMNMRVVKIHGPGTEEVQGITIIHVYGPQRDDTKGRLNFYRNLVEYMDHCKQEGWMIMVLGDFNVEWAATNENGNDEANLTMIHWRELNEMTRVIPEKEVTEGVTFIGNDGVHSEIDHVFVSSSCLSQRNEFGSRQNGRNQVGTCTTISTIYKGRPTNNVKIRSIPPSTISKKETDTSRA